MQRSGRGILDSLYGAAERGLSMLDEQRQSAQSAADQFGDWAQDRLQEVPNPLNVPEEDKSLSRRMYEGVGGYAADQAGKLVEANKLGWQRPLASMGLAPQLTPEEDVRSKQLAREVIEENPLSPLPFAQTPEVRGLASTSEEALRRLGRGGQETAEAVTPRVKSALESLGIGKQADDLTNVRSSMPDVSSAPNNSPSWRSPDTANEMLPEPTVQPRGESRVATALKSLGIEGPAARAGIVGQADEAGRTIAAGGEAVMDDAQRLQASAVERFGVAKSTTTAGYVFPDGQALNLGRRGGAFMDHGEIGEVVQGRPFTREEKLGGQRQFMDATGALRFRDYNDAIVAEVVSPLTPAQQRYLATATRRAESAYIDAPSGARTFYFPQDRGEYLSFLDELKEKPPDIPQADRYYHGTGSDFARPDPGKFDPNGLFGPGYYVTSDSRVAGGVMGEDGIPKAYGGYAIGGTSKTSAPVDTITDLTPRINQLERRLADPAQRAKWEAIKPNPPEGQAPKTANMLEQMEQNLASMRARVEEAQDAISGANIRPVDVPRDLNLLDADAPIPDSMVTSIMRTIPDPERRTIFSQEISHARQFDANNRPLPTVAGALYDAYGDSAGLNKVLADMGYDGIRYAGGKRIPMLDEAGKAIEHNAVVIFPESLDKIRNATAGTPGGLVPGQVNAAAGLARGAAQGAVAGGYEASQEEDADIGDIAQGAALGAAGGAARSVIGKRGPGLVARAVANHGPADEKVAGSITPSKKTDDINISDEAVRQLFDNAVPLRRVAEAAQNVRGGALAFGENAYNLLRLARGAGAAADQALEDALGPVLKNASDQDVWNLNKYLKAKDVIDKDAVHPGHNFGGVTATDAQQALQEMQQALGPKAMQELDQKAQSVWQFGHDLLKRKMDAGLIDQSAYQFLTSQFPHYSPIRIIDWIDDMAARGGSGMGSSNRLSVTADGIKAMTDAGTSRAAETPLDAYVRLAHETYRRSMMNEAAAAMVNHLADLSTDPTWAKLMTPADDTAARLIGQKVVPRAPEQVPFSAFVNGERVDFWLDKKLEQAINYTAPNMSQDWFTKIVFGIPAEMLRKGATGWNALFLIPNAIRDGMTYAVRGGGVMALPETLPALAKGWKSALTKDDAYRQMRLAGGGQAGFFGAEAGAGVKTINNLRGINQNLKAVFGVVPRAGERVESATRLAEYHRALGHGASKQEAALAARDVTIDFARGGEFSKRMNAFIPFFNARMQAPAQVVRVLQNPATRGRAITGVMSTVVVPTIGLELYNRADPTYEDVPQYDKDRGLIIMSPWGPGPKSPETGRPVPHYFVIGLSEWTPFAIAVREAMAQGTGSERGAWETLKASFSQVAPMQGDVADFLPPLAKQAVEQQLNYDTFRDRPIVPEGLAHLPNQEQYQSDTSEVAKLAGRLTGQSPLRIQHAVTGLGAGVGRQALAAGDMALRATEVTPEPSRRVQQLQRDLAKSGLPEGERSKLQRELDMELTRQQTRESGGIRNVPVVGGVASTIYREQGGEIERRTGKQIDERLEQLRNTKDPMGKELSRLGVTFSDVDNEIGGRTLNRYETAEYRSKALQYRERLVQEMMASPTYQSASDADKTRLVRNAMTRGAAWASQDVMPGANTAGREWSTVANKDLDTAVTGYLRAVDAQRQIDDLKQTRYIGYSGDDAEQISSDRSLLSAFRQQFGESQGDVVFRSRYGAARYAKARNARVNPAYRIKVEQLERANSEIY